MLIISPEARKQLNELQSNPAMSKRAKAVNKTLRLLANNPRHPGLNTHEFTELSKRLGVKVWEAYAENNTPRAYRIFWRYGPEKKQISIISILPHG